MRDGLGSIRTVLVLGGTSDIGLEVARHLVAERGARTVVLAARRPEAAKEHAGTLERAGATSVATVGFDVLDTGAHGDLVDTVWAEHGDVDVVVFAAGVLGDQAQAEADTTAALDIVRTNYLGAISVLLEVGRRIERQGHGSIVVLSSVAGQRGRRANYVYGSSKAGLDVFAQGLGDRLHASGGHVLVVRPGFVHTTMTEGRDPAPFSTTPDVVAREVVGALDRRAATVYAPRILRVLLLVLRLLPRPLFRMLPE